MASDEQQSDLEQEAEGAGVEPQVAAEAEAGGDVAGGTEAAEFQDRLLRVQAELENYRKRARREYEEAQRYREIDLLRDLLPVLDNIHRAIEASEKSDDIQGLREGFRMTAQQIEKLLGSHGCATIPTDGTAFDPTVHDAIQQMSVPGVAAGTVVATATRGYRLHDRVVRPAQVVVAKEE
jgi:molecular chaperone GrpE